LQAREAAGRDFDETRGLAAARNLGNVRLELVHHVAHRLNDRDEEAPKRNRAEAGGAAALQRLPRWVAHFGAVEPPLGGRAGGRAHHDAFHHLLAPVKRQDDGDPHHNVVLDAIVAVVLRGRDYGRNGVVVDRRRYVHAVLLHVDLEPDERGGEDHGPTGHGEGHPERDHFRHGVRGHHLARNFQARPGEVNVPQVAPKVNGKPDSEHEKRHRRVLEHHHVLGNAEVKRCGAHADEDGARRKGHKRYHARAHLDQGLDEELGEEDGEGDGDGDEPSEVGG